MPTPRRAALLLLSGLMLAALAACQALGDLAGGMTKPGVSVKAVRLGDLSADGLTLLFDTEVSNPYAVDLPLVNLDYGLASGGTKFLTGAAPVQGSVPAHGAKIVTLPATVRFAPLLTALSGVRPGAVVPYAADMKLSVDLPAVAGGGRYAIPFSKSGELPVPAVPDVSISGLKLGELSLSKAAATLTLNVKNTNQFAVILSKMDLGLDLGGARVSSAALGRELSLTPGQSGTVDIPVELSLAKLGLSAFRSLVGKDSGYRLQGQATVQTPFGPVTLPVDRGGTTKVSS